MPVNFIAIVPAPPLTFQHWLVIVPWLLSIAAILVEGILFFIALSRIGKATAQVARYRSRIDRAIQQNHKIKTES
jgi:hypothetical protein